MKPRKVYVLWLDAVHPADVWEYTSDIKPDQGAIAETVGWLVARNKETIKVAVTVCDRGDDSEQVAGMMTIPLGCVKEIRELSLRGAKRIYKRKQE